MVALGDLPAHDPTGFGLPSELSTIALVGKLIHQLKQSQEAVDELNQNFKQWRKELLEPTGAIGSLERKVDAYAATNRRSLARVRDEVLIAVLRDSAALAVDAPVSVLVVDDMPSVAAAVCRILNDAGVTTLSATSGDSALELLASKVAIDVVLSDIFMPGNGTTLLQHVREDHPRVEVVVMSGYEGQGASYALEHGAHGFLSKPFNADALVLSVTRAAQYRRLRVHGPLSASAKL